MKAFLLGAGASRGCFEDFVVPVSAEFGEVLAVVDPCWKETYPALHLALRHLGLEDSKWSLEPVWTLLDYYAKLQSALPLVAPWRNDSRQIKKALLSVYGKRCDEVAANLAEDSTLGRLFKDELKPGDVLVSFNYDTIAERLAQRLGHRLAAVPRNGDGVKFSKPHGSAAWPLDLRARTVAYCSVQGEPLFSSLCSSDVDCDREPLVLGAVPIKSELIKEIQGCFETPDVFNTVTLQWRAVVEAVRDADVIVVVGYSFPSEDQYGEFLFQEGLRLRTTPPRVEVFEVETRMEDVCRRIRQVFRGRLREVVCRGAVQPHAA